MSFAACASSAPPPELDVVVRELTAIVERLGELTATARTLSGETDWQARAARVFHERADRWAGDVSSLQCVSETTRLEARQARDRAALAAWACP